MLSSKYHNSTLQWKNSTNIASLTTVQYIDIFLIIFLATGFVCYGGAIHVVKQILHPKQRVHIDNYLRGSNGENSESLGARTESDNSDTSESVISPPEIIIRDS
jgi:hypothetical protein